MKAGAYDIVFTLNDRPVAMWPMDAAIKVDHEVKPSRSTIPLMRSLPRK